MAILRVLLGLISIVAVAAGLVAVGGMFYFLAKKSGSDGAERRVWARRYYKAMGAFIALWLVGALCLFLSKSLVRP